MTDKSETYTRGIAAVYYNLNIFIDMKSTDRYKRVAVQCWSIKGSISPF